MLLGDMDDITKRLKDLEKKISFLEQRRMTQNMYLPQSVKNKAMGEANSYVFSGLAADLPADGDIVGTQSYSIYWAWDTHKLYIWDGTIWRSSTFT